MAKKKESIPCHACDGTMERGTHSMTFSYKNTSTEVLQPGWYCHTCDESLHNEVDVASTEQAISDFRAEVDRVLKARDVARIRKRLKLSQRKAGVLLGGGARAFHKYEKSLVSVSQSMSNLLRLLDKDPKRLRELEGVSAR